MPGLEQMMDAFALDQRTGEDRAKMRWALAGGETLDIHPARQVKEFLFWKTLHAECFRCFFREHEDKIGQVVLLDEPVALEEEILFPPFAPGQLRLWRRLDRAASHLAAVAMPRRDFDNRGDAALVRFAEGKQTIARPTVNQIVAPGSEMAGGDPIEVFLFRAVVVRTVEKR